MNCRQVTRNDQKQNSATIAVRRIEIWRMLVRSLEHSRIQLLPNQRRIAFFAGKWVRKGRDGVVANVAITTCNLVTCTSTKPCSPLLCDHCHAEHATNKNKEIKRVATRKCLSKDERNLLYATVDSIFSPKEPLLSSGLQREFPNISKQNIVYIQMRQYTQAMNKMIGKMKNGCEQRQKNILD